MANCKALSGSTVKGLTVVFGGRRYIEGLTSGSRSVGGWEKSLYAKPPENPAASPVSDKLPVHWLADPGSQENAVSALWALRDHMLNDALTISRTLDRAQL